LEQVDVTRTSQVDETPTAAREPQLEIDRLIVEDPISSSNVSQLLKESTAANKWCYKKELQLNPTLAGAVDLRLTVFAADRPNEVKVVDSTLDNKELEKCLVRIQERLSFPKPARDVQVSYRLTFSSVALPSRRRIMRPEPE
jgi:hypothetical protein